MRTITILSLMLFTFIVNAQKSNLIFYTEQGEKFQVVLNGILQNATPETNVKVTDLNAPNYQTKIIFENQALGQVDKMLYFNPGNETTFAIKKDKNGSYVVRFRSEVPVAQAPPTPVGQTAVVYTTVPATTTVSVTETTTTTSGNPNNNVSVGMNLGGVNFSMNVNDGMGNSASSTTTSTSYTTTTTSSTSTGGNVIIEQPQPTTTVVYVPGYTGSVGCPAPVSPAEFANIKNTIASKSFEDSKLTIAKQVVGAKCLLCSQVKEIMLLFSFEDTRLQFAKFAYKYTYDISNYYMLNDAFTFESSIDELNQYINGGY